MLYGNGTPDVVGPWSVNGGQVHWGENIGGQGLGGTYFGPVGTYKVVTDPACAPGGILDTTDKVGIDIRTGVTNGCPLQAIADSSGKIVLQSPSLGKRGTLGQETIIGPGSWTMDGSLGKQFRISESKSVQLWVDATNVMNRPQPNNPQYSINNSAFGTIAAKGNQTRNFQGQLRINFQAIVRSVFICKTGFRYLTGSPRHFVTTGENPIRDRSLNLRYLFCVPAHPAAKGLQARRSYGLVYWPQFQFPTRTNSFVRFSREAPMKKFLACVSAIALVLGGAHALAQQKATAQNVPEITYASVPNFLKVPTGETLGEAVGVATNSKGHIFVYHRSANTRLWEFDKNGVFVKEIGKGYYGFEFAHSVRVDAQDNIWTVDEGTNTVTKFSPEGKFLMVLGRRPPAVDGAVATSNGPNPPAQKYIFCRPTDVGWDPQGNIFVSDGYCNNRVVKYDKNGRFLAQAGSEKAGNGPGEFNLPHGLQVDGQGNVWVADRSNNRYQVLDNNLRPKTTYTNLGVGWTVCVSPGPHQYVFASNSNPNGNGPGTWDNTGEIYKLELDGTILGKFGHASKELGGFQVVHMMDCRNPNEIVVGEIESWRVQKLILQPAPAKPSTAR